MAIVVGVYLPMLPSAVLAWIEPDAPPEDVAGTNADDQPTPVEPRVARANPSLGSTTGSPSCGERGLSRQDLADALDVNYQTIGYLERREYNPSLELAFKIAELFGVPIEAVFSRNHCADVRAALRPPETDAGSA